MAERTGQSDAEKVAEATGLSDRAAAWVAFAALHAGGFTRPQLQTWVAASPESARRITARIAAELRDQSLAKEADVAGIDVTHIHHKAVYRALGEPDNRNRRKPSREKALERLLALDYVLDHPDENWLPTERVKTAALDAAGIPQEFWSSTTYGSQDDSESTTRQFVEKWPMAIDAARRRALLTCVSPGTTDYRVRNWLRDWAPLVRAFGVAGFSVRLVHVTFRPGLSEQAGKLLARAAERYGDGAGDEDVATIRQIKDAIRINTDEAFAPFGGFQEALKTARSIYARRGRDVEETAAQPVEVATEAWTSERIQPTPEAAK